MDPVSLVVEQYRQMAFGAAILGGFAVTFLSALLTAYAPERRIGTWAIGATAAAAVLLIVATMASTLLLISAPVYGLTFDFSAWPSDMYRAKWIAEVSFFLGIAVLFVGIGLSGWARSRATGYITAIAAAVGVVLVLVILIPTF